MTIIPLCLTLFIALPVLLPAAEGIVRGTVHDGVTLQPLGGTNVTIEGSTAGAATDSNGVFEIRLVPPGTLQLRASRLGYSSRVLTAVVVHAERITQVEFKLQQQLEQMDTVEVVAHAEYFDAPREMKVSTQTMRFEEIRRAAGGIEDIQRVVQQLPGVVSTTDQDNEVIVRGGNPNENMFLLDGLELPNINHFGVQGAGGGPIGMLNNELVREVDFLAGAFPARWDGKLSSVMDISLRSGRRDRLQDNINLSMSGAGALLEGPAGAGTSWIVSFRRSYLSLIHGAVGLTAIPEYWNSQLKVTHQITPLQKLMFNGIYGDDYISFSDSAQTAYSRGAEDVDSRGHQGALGLTLDSYWSERHYSRTVLGVSENYWDLLVKKDKVEWVTINNRERLWQLRSDHTWQLTHRLELYAGAYWKTFQSDYDEVISADTVFYYDPADPAEDPEPVGWDPEHIEPRHAVDWSGYDQLPGGYFEFKLNWHRFFIRPGVHLMYTGWSDELTFSPRLALVLPSSPVSWKAAWGRSHQPPSPSLTHIYNKDSRLSPAFSDQVVIGAEWRPRDDLKITLTGYQRWFRKVPISRSLTTTDSLDSGFDYVNAGEGDSRGVEFFMQQRMTRGYYYIISLAASRAERIDPRDGSTRLPDSWDYRQVVSLSGGRKIPFHHKPWYQQLKKQWWFNLIAWLPVTPADELELLLHYRYLGGRPYTESIYYPELRRWLTDGSTPFNGARYPHYSRLDLRIDRRFFFGRTNLVTYLEVENLFDRKNIFKQDYTSAGERVDILQFRRFIVGGVVWEF